MNYLFWNTNKNENINNILKLLIESYSCDIIGLAEYNDNINNLIKELFNDGYELYQVFQTGCDRIRILTKYRPTYIKPYYDDGQFTIKKMPHDTLGNIITGLVHLSSKLYKGPYDKFAELIELKYWIEKAETLYSNNKVIIMGDFNINPFEEPMVSASAAHSLSCRNVVKKNSRIVDGHKHNMFYNPMWNLLGDLKDPPGTYYYERAEQVNYFWNIYDQVIISPSLMSHFDTNSLKIIDKINGISLTDKNGRPNISDHLPIYFEIN